MTARLQYEAGYIIRQCLATGRASIFGLRARRAGARFPIRNLWRGVEVDDCQRFEAIITGFVSAHLPVFGWQPCGLPQRMWRIVGST